MRASLPIHPRLVVFAGMLGCGPQVEVPSGGSTGHASTGGELDPTGGGPGASAAMTGSAATSAGTTVDPDGTTGEVATFGGHDDDPPPLDEGWSDFIGVPDVYCAPRLPPGSKAIGPLICDLFAQDCPAGEKCMPAALCDATVWNSTTCMPVDPDAAQAGDPCTVQDIVTSGIDDCDIGLMCGFVDPMTLQGTCVPMCTGSEDSPICEADTEVCTVAYEVMALCLPSCNPWIDDCELGTCVPAGDAFACFFDGDAIAPGEPCEYLDDCAPGSVCAAEGFTGDCGGTGHCCALYCDLNAPDPNAACAADEECAPWFRPGSVGPPLDAVGVCAFGS